MDLLQQGVERSVIALWLGHESIETTQIYLDADLELKQQVLDAVTPSTESRVGIDLTTSSSPSSTVCDDTDYVSALKTFRLPTTQIIAQRDIVRHGT
jgi:hypothetical protein